MRKFILTVVLTFLTVPVFSQVQPTGWTVAGYQISNGDWTVEVTYSSFILKNKESKKTSTNLVDVRLVSTDKSFTAIYHSVDLSHPERDKRVGSVCEFFLEKNGTVELKSRKEKIVLPTYKKLVEDTKKTN